MANDSVDCEKLGDFLQQGIKVICFVSQEMKNELVNKEWRYVDFPYLEVYENINGYEFELIDGKLTNEIRGKLEALEEKNKGFNMAQYLVEHAEKESDLCVEAGAGTGKTHVMVNRIMFLFHTDEEFSFSKVVMITFTNKATDQMRHRLLKELNRRYILTRNERYLRALEEVTQVEVCTIHSFFRKIIIEIGPLLGYGTSLGMRSYAQEKREILRDIMDSSFGNSTGKVEEKFGLQLNHIEKLAILYWEKLENLGVTEDETVGLDWGSGSDFVASKVQKQLENIFKNVDEEYNRCKFINNAISMKDIIHELGRVISTREVKEYITSSYDYIFCDEFQDSDAVQIKTIVLLSQIYKSRLFVVGDVKQSIYRFRGATEGAFEKLTERAKEIDFLVIPLKKNYRTTETIMTRIDKIFLDWNKKGYMSYREQDRLLPQNKNDGIYKEILVTKKTREEKVIETIRRIWENASSATITVLTRTNDELKKIKEWCDHANIPNQIRERGGFFRTPAVLDFCALLEGLLYDSEPMYLWELLNSSYVDADIEKDSVLKIAGNRMQLLGFFSDKLEALGWEKYRVMIKEKPILSVLREIISERNPLGGYLNKRTRELMKKNYPQEELVNQVILDLKSYEANLEKLLQHLQNNFAGEFSSLYDVCTYLRSRVLTDGAEEVAETEQTEQIGYVQGYTVHGAKGLEFDHVLIPFMTNLFVTEYRSDLLISDDNKQVGWICRRENMSDIHNDNFLEMIEKENNELLRDETRLLYVAMTRAISSLYCFPTRQWGVEGVKNWSGLILKDEGNA